MGFPVFLEHFSFIHLALVTFEFEEGHQTLKLYFSCLLNLGVLEVVDRKACQCSPLKFLENKWDKVFKNGPSEICGR